MNQDSYQTESKFLIILTFLWIVGFGFVVYSIGNEAFFLLINQHVTPNFGIPARIFSALGESLPMGILVFLSLFISFRKGFALASSWLLGSLFSWLFKLWLAREALRPQKFFRDQHFEINTVHGVQMHHYHSFPSGHTITAFTILFMLPFLFPGRGKGLQSVFCILAIGCGFSRIVLGQHWPVDVLAGSFFGSMAGWITATIFSKWSGPKWFSGALPIPGFLAGKE